jgi:uncharacterized protein YjiS (DUF1127 family)/ketosteroid isomerase-like protein
MTPADNNEPDPVRRKRDGVIDIAYYVHRAGRLRTRWMRRLIGRIAHFRQRRAAEAELHALDARTLHDIGIAPGDIPAIASGVYFRDDGRRQRGIPAAHRPATPGSPDRAAAFRRSWIDAWNRRDLDAVLAHCTDDFEFSSPVIGASAGPSGRKAARAHWQTILSNRPALRCGRVEMLAGVDCLAILYRGHGGLAIEVFQFDGSGRATRAQALYRT